MIAFHGDPKVKAKYLARLRAHAKADEIIHGVYWEHGKGCAVGCTIHSDRHDSYETELGIPVAIAYLEDSIFERLQNGDAKAFPLRFLEAIPVGADLSLVISQFIYWMLSDETWGLKPDAEDTKQAVNAVSECYRRRIAGDEPTETQWEAAGKAAWVARDARAARAAFRKASAEKLLELLAAAPVKRRPQPAAKGR